MKRSKRLPKPKFVNLDAERFKKKVLSTPINILWVCIYDSDIIPPTDEDTDKLVTYNMSMPKAILGDRINKFPYYHYFLNVNGEYGPIAANVDILSVRDNTKYDIKGQIDLVYFITFNGKYHDLALSMAKMGQTENLYSTRVICLIDFEPDAEKPMEEWKRTYYMGDRATLGND